MRGTRPRRRAHADAREGRHVAGGGPTGIVGPGNSGGAVTQLANDCAPLFKRAVSRYFFRVGLCPTHFLPFAGYVDARWTSDFVGTEGIAWTRVHAIIKSTRALNGDLSDDDRRAHRSPRGDMRRAYLHQH